LHYMPKAPAQATTLAPKINQRCGGKLHLRNELIVVGVRPDPEPDYIVTVFDSDSPIVNSDTH
jgi:hypothetical protein